MVEHFFSSQLARGVVECGLAALLSFLVLLLIRRRGVNLLGSCRLLSCAALCRFSRWARFWNGCCTVRNGLRCWCLRG